MTDTTSAGDDSFRCPWCGARGPARWYPVVVGYEHKGAGAAPAWFGLGREAEDLGVSVCDECDRPTVWYQDRPAWPTPTAPRPRWDMPAAVRADYEEARQVVDQSPSSAAALLRRSVRTLCVHLGHPGRDLDENVDQLVLSGLPGAVREDLRAARAVGGARVAPGVIDPGDDRATAMALFDLVNVMVEKMISEPAAWGR